MANHQRGAGVNMVPELLLRQVIMDGVVELAADAPRLDELFERVDNLYEGSQYSWSADMRARVREIATTPGLLRVGVGYPMSPGVIPYVSIVVESGGEQADEAMTGDIANESTVQTGVPSATDPAASSVEAHTVLATGWSTTLQVGVWSRAPEESVLLHSIVREILFREKGRLLTAGVHDVGFTESGFSPEGSPLYPDVGYVPMLRAVMRWTLRSTRREGPVPTRVTMRAGTFTA